MIFSLSQREPSVTVLPKSGTLDYIQQSLDYIKAFDIKSEFSRLKIYKHAINRVTYIMFRFICPFNLMVY